MPVLSVRWVPTPTPIPHPLLLFLSWGRGLSPTPTPLPPHPGCAADRDAEGRLDGALWAAGLGRGQRFEVRPTQGRTVALLCPAESPKASCPTCRNLSGLPCKMGIPLRIHRRNYLDCKELNEHWLPLTEGACGRLCPGTQE